MKKCQKILLNKCSQNPHSPAASPTNKEFLLPRVHFLVHFGFVLANKNNFYPVPRTNSAIIDLKKLPNPLKEKNLGRYLKQYVYQHEAQKVKNSLKEGIINSNKIIYSNKVTKKEAEKTVNSIGIPNVLLDCYSHENSIYFLVGHFFD